jgi:hypothetical protein
MITDPHIELERYRRITFWKNLIYLTALIVFQIICWRQAALIDRLTQQIGRDALVMKRCADGIVPDPDYSFQMDPST